MIRRVSAGDLDGLGTAALDIRRLYRQTPRLPQRWRRHASGVVNYRVGNGLGFPAAVSRAMSAFSPLSRDVPITTVSPTAIEKVLSMMLRVDIGPVSALSRRSSGWSGDREG